MLPSLLLPLLRIPLDFLAFSGGFFLAFLLRQTRWSPVDIPGIALGDGPLPTAPEFLSWAAALAAGFLLLEALAGEFSFARRWRPARTFFVIFQNVAAFFFLLLAAFFFSRELFFSRAILVFAFPLTILLLWLGRALLAAAERGLFLLGGARRKTLLLGGGELAEQLARELAKDPRREVERRPAGVFSLRLEKEKPAEIFLLEALGKKETADLFATCRENQIELRFLPPVLELASRNAEIEIVAGLPVVFLSPSPLDSGWARVGKRAFDFLGAAILLLFLLPVLLLVALAVKLDSPGPIFFRDLRVGRDGKKFLFRKFRSMKTELCTGAIDGSAEGEKLLDSLKDSPADLRAGDPVRKIQNDPRVTRVGRFLRKTSLDELPELLHVLSGKMSLVGPRPHPVDDVQRYRAWHRRRFAVKPGITGAAQVAGRSELAFDEEVRLDLSWLENWRWRDDFVILAKTALEPFRARHRE
jgi:exopolysaccharide biosynthesis polyprenyl glycosylphosphotransferase